MQNIKVFIIVVFVDFTVIFLYFGFLYCLLMAAAYITPCCNSSNGFNGCIPGCVTLTTHLYLFVALGRKVLNTFIYLKRQRCFISYLARTTMTYPCNIYFILVVFLVICLTLVHGTTSHLYKVLNCDFNLLYMKLCILFYQFILLHVQYITNNMRTVLFKGLRLLRVLEGFVVPMQGGAC